MNYRWAWVAALTVMALALVSGRARADERNEQHIRERIAFYEDQAGQARTKEQRIFAKGMAIYQMGELGPAAKEFEEEVLNELAGPDGEALAQKIGGLLVLLGDDRMTIVEDLLRDKKITERARDGVKKAFSEVAQGRKDLRSPSGPARLAGLGTLSRYRVATLDDMRGALKDADPAVRLRAASMARQRGSELTDGDWESLQAMMKDPDAKVRTQSALSVLYNRSRSVDDLEAVYMQCRNEPEVLRDLWNFAGEKGIQKESSFDLLLSDLNPRHAANCISAIRTLRHCRKYPAKVLPALARLWGQPPVEVRREVSQAWGEIIQEISRNKWEGDPIAVLQNVLGEKSVDRGLVSDTFARLLDTKLDVSPLTGIAVKNLADKDGVWAWHFLADRLRRRERATLDAFWNGFVGSDTAVANAVREHLDIFGGGIVFAHGLRAGTPAQKQLALREVAKLHEVDAQDFEVVLDTGSDPSPAVRAEVVRTVAAARNSVRPYELQGPLQQRSLELVTRTLRDPDPLVQDAAFAAAGDFADQRNVQEVLWRMAEARTPPDSARAWHVLAAAAKNHHTADMESDADAHRIVMAAVWDADPDVRDSARSIKDSLWSYEPYPEPPAWKALHIIAAMMAVVCVLLIAATIWGSARWSDVGLDVDWRALELAWRAARGTGLVVVAYTIMVLGIIVYEGIGQLMAPPVLFGALILVALGLSGVCFITWGGAVRGGRQFDRGMLFAWAVVLALVFGAGTVMDLMLALLTLGNWNFTLLGRLGLELIALTGAGFVATQLIRAWVTGPPGNQPLPEDVRRWAAWNQRRN